MVDRLNNVADMYRREAITILGNAVNVISEKSDDVQNLSISGQKSGLKVSILNLLKLTAKFLIGHILVKGCDERAKRVTNFLQVLNLYQDDLFGDAYYDLQYRRNVNLRKLVNLPNVSKKEILQSWHVQPIQNQLYATQLIMQMSQGSWLVQSGQKIQTKHA